MPTLESDKRNLTRDRIMEALAEEVCRRGTHELSVQGVADRAGVSHRTVYRHFESKDELFAAYAEWLDELLDSKNNMPAELSEVPERAVETFRRFEEHPRLVEAYVRIHSTGTTVSERQARSTSFLDLVHRGTPQLSGPHQRAIAAVMRQVVNSATWACAREEFDVGDAPLQEVASWVTRMIVVAVESGDVPVSWKRED